MRAGSFSSVRGSVGGDVLGTELGCWGVGADVAVCSGFEAGDEDAIVIRWAWSMALFE